MLIFYESVFHYRSDTDEQCPERGTGGAGGQGNNRVVANSCNRNGAQRERTTSKSSTVTLDETVSLWNYILDLYVHSFVQLTG